MRKAISSLSTALLVAGLVVVSAVPAVASRVISSFAPGLTPNASIVGLAYSTQTDTLLLYGEFGDPIHEFSLGGSLLGTIPRPGLVSNDFDMDVLEEAVAINEGSFAATVPAGSILVVNGEQSPADVFGIDRQGNVLGHNQLPGTLVGGSYHNDRNTYFVLDWTAKEVREVDLVTGTALNTFSADPDATNAPFGVFYGDVAVSPTNGNLFIVSSSQEFVREMTPTGTFVRDFEVGTLGITGMSGIDFDPEGTAWISTTAGTVFNVALEPSPGDRLGGGGTGCDPKATQCGTENDDTLQTENGHVDAGPGNDDVTATITAETTSITVDAGSGADIIDLVVQDPSSTATVTLIGEDGPDTFRIPPFPGALQPVLLGGAGGDIVKVVRTSSPRLRAFAASGQTAGGYEVESGGGNDTVTTGSTGDAVDGGAGRDTVNGGGGGDDLDGAGGPDGIDGGVGNDDLGGGSGDDVLHGGDGANLLKGGTGRDTCLSDTRKDRFRGCERIRRNHRRNHQMV